jgi:hypothetical protein
MSSADMKISELRKMLKEQRKGAIAPVSKMQKHQILMELEKFGSSTPSSAPAVVKQEKAVNKVVKEVLASAPLPKPKAPKVAKAPLLTEPPVSKKELDRAVEPEKQIARTKLIKGSQEARDFMASIRMKKSKDKDVS